MEQEILEAVSKSLTPTYLKNSLCEVIKHTDKYEYDYGASLQLNGFPYSYMINFKKGDNVNCELHMIMDKYSFLTIPI